MFATLPWGAARETRNPLGSIVIPACLSNKTRRPTCTLREREREVHQLLALFLLPDIKPCLSLTTDVSLPRNFIASLAREDNRLSSTVFIMYDNVLGAKSNSFNPYLYYFSNQESFLLTLQG